MHPNMQGPPSCNALKMSGIWALNAAPGIVLGRELIVRSLLSCVPAGWGRLWQPAPGHGGAGRVRADGEEALQRVAAAAGAHRAAAGPRQGADPRVRGLHLRDGGELSAGWRRPWLTACTCSAVYAAGSCKPELGAPEVGWARKDRHCKSCWTQRGEAAPLLLL
jgi:hypothetical protein